MSLNKAGTIGGTTEITFHEGDDVEVFIERFDMAMRCGDVKEEKWTMKLLCSLSLDAYKRVKNELFPEELEGITYVRVRETLVKIFRKSTNIYKCRYEFNLVKKAEGEDVDGFINRLKEAARKCKFEAGELQSRMLDRLVAGINSPMLVERLLNEPKLTYETAAEICRTYEVARNTQFADSYVNVVNEVKNKSKSRVDFSCDRGKSYVCGDAQGQDDSGRNSHSESMVSETTYSVGNEYKVLESSECTVSDCETFVVERVEPYRVNVTVNGEIVNFIVDTGSELTLLPEKVFTQLRIKSTMKPTLVKLKAYNGSQVKVLGETEMNLKLCESNREFRINVVVVREGSCPILERDVLSLAGFDFKSVFELENCNENATSACQYEVPRHYQKVFDTGSFEPISKYSASLHVNEAAKPIKYPARKASYHMEPLIAVELNCLESEGIIESNVADVAWLKPIIAVRKSNNKIRLCGSYDLTLNPHIESDFYKIPDPDDIFHKLSGCQFFSKIDMYQAFLTSHLMTLIKSLQQSIHHVEFTYLMFYLMALKAARVFLTISYKIR